MIINRDVVITLLIYAILIVFGYFIGVYYG